MNSKQIIVFILLTTILVILAYALLDFIDRHLGHFIIIGTSLLMVADIILMSLFFARIMKPPDNTQV
jgi:hypothetical protein